MNPKSPQTPETPPTLPSTQPREGTPEPTVINMAQSQSPEKPQKTQQELREIWKQRIEDIRKRGEEMLDEYAKKLKEGEFEDKPGEEPGSGNKRDIEAQAEITQVIERGERMKKKLDSNEELPQESPDILPNLGKQYDLELSLGIFGTPEHGFKGIYINPRDQDYEALKKDTDPTKFGEYFLNPDMQNVDFEHIQEDKIHIIKLPQFVNKPRSEVIEYITNNYPNLKLPGLEYWKWLSENPKKTPNKLQDTKVWFYFPGSLFRHSDGYWCVPYTSWSGSSWGRRASWLSSSWDANDRIVLLEI